MKPDILANWQTILARAITDPQVLLERLELDASQFKLAPDNTTFPLRVPEPYVARIRPGDPDNPLLRQVLPVAEEARQHPDYSVDPVGDLQSVSTPGLLRKYRGRALMIPTGSCAIHCRYCFRRHFPYKEHRGASSHLEQVINAVRTDPGLGELILSGGDPLSLTDEKLARIGQQLAAIPHLKRLRIHTRLPVIVPARVTDGLLHWISSLSLKTIIVLHINHADEIDAEVSKAASKLAAAGATLFNQSVLLKGVNDRVDTLAELSEALFSIGVQPYYLHMLDRVQGTAHFEVGESQARQLMRLLRARLPGYLVPRLVREIPGAPAKQPVDCEMSEQ